MKTDVFIFPTYLYFSQLANDTTLNPVEQAWKLQVGLVLRSPWLPSLTQKEWTIRSCQCYTGSETMIRIIATTAFWCQTVTFYLKLLKALLTSLLWDSCLVPGLAGQANSLKGHELLFPWSPEPVSASSSLDGWRSTAEDCTDPQFCKPVSFTHPSLPGPKAGL